MNSPQDLERVSIERVMSDEKKIVMLEALKVRITQHQAGFNLASARISACLDLIKKAPAQEDVLLSTIDVWVRIRNYHEKILMESRNLKASFEP